jgi:hypothetical protein
LSFAGEKDLDGRSLVNEIAGDINVMLKRKIKIVKVVYLLNFFRIISEKQVIYHLNLFLQQTTGSSENKRKIWLN